jgi:hypothetical protein
VFPTLKDALISELSGAGLGEWAGQLFDAFVAQLQGKASNTFLAALDNILRQTIAMDSDVAAWQTAISMVRRHALPYLDGQARSRAEDLFGQARVLIGDTAQRAQAVHQLQAERQAETLREIGQALITTFDVESWQMCWPSACLHSASPVAILRCTRIRSAGPRNHWTRPGWSWLIPKRAASNWSQADVALLLAS